MKRVGIAGFLHESNTFLSVPTAYENFAANSLTLGAELIARWSGAHHELGGFLAGASEQGFEGIGLLATFAIPSGAIETEAFDRIAHELLQAIVEAQPLDGLLIALHGATASVGYPDADGELLERIRALLGPDLPIVTTLDLHANVSARMVEHSTATVIYSSNPHLDQAARGLEAATLMGRILHGEIHPVQALETPPLLIPISRQYTSEQPAAGLYHDASEVRRQPGILSASVAMGFYYADVEEAGVSFLVIADGDATLARDAAQWMARRAWQRRHEFVSELPSPREAVRLAAHSSQTPVVLMDVGDNVGGGGPGDSTILFAEILQQAVPDAMLILYDPAAVRECVKAGPGASVQLDVGAKTDRLHGCPITIRGQVRTISDGRFTETEARHGGWGQFDQGITAVAETEAGHTVVLTSRRMAPMSLQQVLSVGIRPERKRVLIVKGVVAPRAAYEPIAARIILVDTPGVTADNPRHFQYRRRRAPLFPLEPDAEY